jgi:hypothetical protein
MPNLLTHICSEKFDLEADEDELGSRLAEAMDDDALDAVDSQQDVGDD